MKILKIYNIIATLLIAVLLIWIAFLRKELAETNEVLDQCSARYYELIKKSDE